MGQKNSTYSLPLAADPWAGIVRNDQDSRTMSNGMTRGQARQMLNQSNSTNEEEIINTLAPLIQAQSQAEGFGHGLALRRRPADSSTLNYSDRELMDNAMINELSRAMKDQKDGKGLSVRQQKLISAYQKTTNNAEYMAELRKKNLAQRGTYEEAAQKANADAANAYHKAVADARDSDDKANKAHEIDLLSIARNSDNMRLRTAVRVGDQLSEISKVLAAATGTKAVLGGEKGIARQTGLYVNDWENQQTHVQGPTTQTAESMGFDPEKDDIHSLEYYAQNEL